MIENQRSWPYSFALKAADLYTRFPFRKYLTITDQFDNEKEAREFCGRVFKQFMFYVIEDIIENNVMLKFPPGCRAWMEMAVYSDEDFKIARQNGAFQDVDFLASNFTGYQLTLRFQNRYKKWIKRIYLSAPHRDRITALTNQGKSLVSARTKEVRHYVDKVQEKFPILSKSEINKICTYGLKFYAFANRNHCDVTLFQRNGDIMTAYCGKVFLDNEHFWRNWHLKYRMKERLLYHLRRTPWDGYYYIGLTQEEHDEIMAQHGKIKHFRNVYPVKVKKELYHERWCWHIWRVPFPIDCGWKFFREKIDTDKAEYVELNKYDSIHKLFQCRVNHGSTSAEHE